MRMLGRITAAALLLALFTLPVYAVDPNESRTPLMRTVEPFKASAGERVVVSGDNLGNDRVASVFLADAKVKDPEKIRLEIVSQSAQKVEIKLPATIKPGRYVFVVLLTDSQTTLLEEPVKLTIE